MTNAIKQSKREMYAKFSDLYTHVLPSLKSYELCKIFESALESYLELLRQDHEALHETARKRFEDIQGLEAALEKSEADNKVRQAHLNDKIDQLAKMTEKRDLLLNRQQASEAAHATRSEKGATVHQSSEENVSCAKLDGKTAAILGAVVDVRQILADWAVYGYKAKKQMKKLAYAINNNPELHAAMLHFDRPDTYATWFLNNDKCMHSFPSGEQCVFCGVGK